MEFREILRQQRSGLEAMSGVGVIGLHLVSGPLVGFAIGYGLDKWLGLHPWGKIVFLFIGIGAGFLNVYRDTQALLRKIARQDTRKGVTPEGTLPATPADGAADDTRA